MVDSAAVAKQPNSFVAELEASNLHPLWDRYQRITPIKPQPKDAPFLWRWRDIEPFLHRAVGEVSINDIERRALIMAHPAFGAETTTTSTLLNCRMAWIAICEILMMDQVERKHRMWVSLRPTARLEW